MNKYLSQIFTNAFKIKQVLHRTYPFTKKSQGKVIRPANTHLTRSFLNNITDVIE